MSYWILAIVAMGVILWIVRRGARAFEARQRALGRWDEEGPLIETRRPRYRYRNLGMEERLEVIGEWEPEVVRRRDPHTGEDPKPGVEDDGATGRPKSE
jgi:hypothetical protein